MKKNNFYLTILLIITAFMSPVKAIAIDSSELNLFGIQETLNISKLTDLNLNIEQLYDSQQYDKIIPLFLDKIQTYETENNLIGQIKTWRDLASIYEKLGQLDQAFSSLEKSLNLYQNLPENEQKQILLAQILDVQGQIELSSGQGEKALNSWTNSAQIYHDHNKILPFTKAKLNQVQALRTLGFYNQAIKTLTEINEQIETESDSLLKAQAWQILGEVWQKVGQLAKAQLTLEKALELTRNNDHNQDLSATILISLGQNFELQGQATEALKYYQQALDSSQNREIKTQAKLYQLNIEKDTSKALVLIDEIKTNLNQLPVNHNNLYRRINLANHLIELNQTPQVIQYLTFTIQQAQTIGDQRASAYALGNLGKLYEKNQRYSEAYELTQKALIISQSINAPDLSYQWQWQLGRILTAQDQVKNRQEAINIYTQAVETLKSIRSELVAISSDNQFSFRKSVEPVYRELASLLLQENANQDQLKQARELIESLQLAEMDNFFKDACLDAKPVKIDELDPHAAIFYPIILPDRLEVIVAIPGEDLIHYRTEIPQAKLETKIKQVQEVLTDVRRRPSSYLPILQEPYQWLIKAIETQLEEHNIKTLVFIPDGKLRNIPFAPLYDGEKYLVEKYNIALAPSLQLIDPQVIAQQNLSMLFVGLSEARQGYNPLPSVTIELNQIERIMNSDILFNPDFTENMLIQKLDSTPYRIVHLATHGEFSSKAENTYLLTWDNKIDINELHYLLNQHQKQKQPIELLVLSACKTAVGDDRATLGLAGIAVRAGARSTLGSLWYVSDDSTSLLMSNFYQQLAQGNMTKSEALRKAQLTLINDADFAHPYYWAPFVLLGNWL